MKDVIVKSIVIGNYYFYNASSDSHHGNIFGFKELTLPKALSILKSIGEDPIKNFKTTITVYYA